LKTGIRIRKITFINIVEDLARLEPISRLGGLDAILYRPGRLRQSAMSSTYKIEVYTDGQCNLCRWMHEHVEPLDRNHRLEWLDYNDAEILKRATPRMREEMAEEMHIRLNDGRWHKGYFAWIEVIRVLPRWKWLAPIMSVWPFTKLGPAFYHWLASRR